MKIKSWWGYILIVLLGFLVYSNTLNGQFIWDDEFLILHNPLIRTWRAIPMIFTHHAGAGSDARFTSYRPFRSVTYMLNYHLHRFSVGGYHIGNILLHILTALALLYFVKMLIGNQLAAFLSSLLFLVHPVHTEAVAYISGRADPLAGLFLLLTFIFYLKDIQKSKLYYVLLSAACYALALFSKEMTVVFPFLLLAYHKIYARKIHWRGFVPLLIVLVLCVATRFSIVNSRFPHQELTESVFLRLPGFFVALASYIRLLWLPIDLHMEYGAGEFGWGDPSVWIGVGIVALVVGAFLRHKKITNKLCLFCVAWFFIMLLPVSNLYPFKAYLKEHFLYFPSIGFFILMGQWLALNMKDAKSRRMAIIICSLFVGIFSKMTFMQNQYWRDPLIFYTRTLEFAPNSVRMNNNLGMIYERLGFYELAFHYYKKALALNSNYVEANYNLGNVYLKQKDTEKALAQYRKALELNPKYSKALNNMGNVYAEREEYEKALDYYQRAMRARFEPLILKNMGLLLKKMGRYREAIEIYEKSLNFYPKDVTIHNSLGILYQKMGEGNRAINSYQKAIEINPNFWIAYYNMGSIYQITRNYELAASAYLKAVDIRPHYPPLNLSLAYTLVSLGKKDLAFKYYMRAKEAGLFSRELDQLFADKK